ncbi:hypothetical protein ACFSC6_12705 [Rufibacter sediminis]|uniref:Uncharacterized protein n=1 Tax=Rufibacter sediminis TaxID=2762756 RepID=A0ABR6VVB4_9BACT|nr:hypothetical protein [Rufibacter sediminis]MBC3540743.1 hypothetical protein [Rufibacter sediminis]
MKLIVLLFAMCIGSGLALQDALSGIRYNQEVIYINQSGAPMPGPTAEDAETATPITYHQGTTGKVSLNA